MEQSEVIIQTDRNKPFFTDSKISQEMKSCRKATLRVIFRKTSSVRIFIVARFHGYNIH